ncbi:unnamed protein product [Lactuca saligna]|uniref:Uncharacterized protein n=1 Tax=Lactuca saligna TaxID=75948 RepID=A0AA35YFS6_LACSI|nr:unnamed protein product [Lactuca saligna]
MGSLEAGLLISSVFSMSSIEPERRKRMSASRTTLFSGSLESEVLSADDMINPMTSSLFPLTNMNIDQIQQMIPHGRMYPYPMVATFLVAELELEVAEWFLLNMTWAVEWN